MNMCRMTTAAAVTAIAVLNVSADAGSVSYGGMDLYQKVKIHHADVPNGAVTVYAGLMKWVNPDDTLAFESFCIQLDKEVQKNTNVDFTPHVLPTSATTLTLQSSGLLERFWASHYDSLFDVNLSLTDRKINAAAFQVGVWEIVYDYGDLLNGLNVALGAFKMTDNNNVKNRATTMLGNIGQDHAHLKAMVSPLTQDQLTMAPTPSAAAVGLVGLAVVALRRRNARA